MYNIINIIRAIAIPLTSPLTNTEMPGEIISQSDYSDYETNIIPLKLKKIIDGIPPGGVIVYDIDDTLIDKMGNPILPIVESVKYATSKGILIVIITARIGTKQTIDITKEQMNALNIKFEEIYFFGSLDRKNEYIPKYKEKARKIAHKFGIVYASVGDMEWDVGKYGGTGYIVK